MELLCISDDVFGRIASEYLAPTDIINFSLLNKATYSSLFLLTRLLEKHDLTQKQMQRMLARYVRINIPEDFKFECVVTKNTWSGHALRNLTPNFKSFRCFQFSPKLNIWKIVKQKALNKRIKDLVLGLKINGSRVRKYQTPSEIEDLSHIAFPVTYINSTRWDQPQL